MDHIASRIIELRTSLGISETALADTCAIPRTTFKRRLVDPRTITLAELDRLADALNTTPEWLWFGEDAA